MPPENGTPIGADVVLHGEPAPQLGVQRLDVVTADDVEVRRQRLARRIEEAAMDGIRIGTSDEPQRRDVVRRHHARVARMELSRPAAPRQLRARSRRCARRR